MNNKTREFMKNRAIERKVESLVQPKHKSLYPGVSLIKSTGKYTARIYRDGIRYYLGCFASAEAAHKFRERAIKEDDFRDVYDRGERHLTGQVDDVNY